MLRRALLIIGLLCIGIGLAWRADSAPHSGLPFLIWGVLITLAVIFERWRYRRRPASAGNRWQKTAECFEDPETGRIMDVFYDPATGERHYEPRDANGNADKGRGGRAVR